MKTFLRVTALMISFSAGGFCEADEPTSIAKDSIEFARINDQPLLLDLYRLESNGDDSMQRLPLVIWVHGGAWRSGSRTSVPILSICQRGFAIASVDYRLSTEARFPAQVHDIKAAIRFMRARADRYSLDPDRFFIAGDSAGGHLAALVGLSSGVKELEGVVGEHLNASTDVQAIASFYGASNLETIVAQSTPHGLSVRVPALKLLLGDQPDQQRDLAKLASPITHVDPSDPPVLLIHGDQDPQMPINQSHELQGVCESNGVPATFHVVHGGKHGGEAFYTPDNIQKLADFFTLKSIANRP